MTSKPIVKTGGRLLTAAAVATLTLMVVVHAGAVALTPNAALYNYNLGPGTVSAPITVPAANQSILVMGTCTTSGSRGVGQVAMLHIPSNFLEWVGLNSTSNGTITQGYSGTSYTKIVQIDWRGEVFLEVADADSFYIVNTSTGIRAGNVTLIW